MTSIAALLTHLLTTLESALPSGPLMPSLAPTAAITARATTASTRAAADSSSPLRIANLRTAYENDFGFTSGLRRGFDKTIWEPWRGVNGADFEAVLAVAEVLGMPASHILALWLQEGKHAHDSTLHGAAHAVPALHFGVDVSASQIRSWLRSVVLYQVFGSDFYTAYTRVPNADNILDGAQADHDGKFAAGLNRLRADMVPGSTDFTISRATTYFASTTGALRDLVLVDPAGNPITAVLPAGVTLSGSTRLRVNSISSWLYLQVGLFMTYRTAMERRFVAEYGPPMDLAPTPWVTYLGWNGGVTQQYDARFANRPAGETPEDRIKQLFEAPPRSRLNAAELALYDAGPISTSALGNALQFKYLIEAVEPWFVPGP